MTAYCFAHQIEGITPLKRNSVVIPLIKGNTTGWLIITCATQIIKTWWSLTGGSTAVH